MEDAIRSAESLQYQIRQLNLDHLGVSERKHYSDENTGRRNHYLDLAGIENYTSQSEGILKIRLKNIFILQLRLIKSGDLIQHNSQWVTQKIPNSSYSNRMEPLMVTPLFCSWVDTHVYVG